MMRALPALVLVIAGFDGSAAAQDAEPLFNGKNLDGWKREFAEAKVQDGAIHVESSTGWFNDKSPADALRLTKRFTPAAGPDARWEAWRIACAGRRVQLTVDGEPVYSNETIRNPQGFIALWASDGRAEFRSVEIRQMQPRHTTVPDVVSPKDPGVAVPKLLREVKPAYTRAAMERHIEGTVLLDAVVERDGTIGDVVVTRSLDPEYGLDQSALTAAKGWRFIAATRDGMPVRILFSIELAFTLK